MAQDLSGIVPKVFSMVLPVLSQEFSLLKNNLKDFSGMAGKTGDTVTIPGYVGSGTSDVVPGAYPAASVDMTPATRTITIDQWKKSDPFRISTQEGTTIFDKPQLVQRQIQEGVRSLLYGANAYMLGKYTSIYGYSGTAGTNPFATDIKPIAALKEICDRQLMTDGNRHLLVSLAAQTAALQSDDLRKFLNLGDSEAIRAGRIGNLMGFSVERDQQIPTHTAGTAASAAVKANVAAGLKTIALKGTGATGTFVVGDIITFANHTQTYVVTAAVADASVADTALTFEPALVSAVVANEAITVKATHVVNLAFDPGAFGLVMRLPSDDLLGNTNGQHFPLVDPVTGVPILLSHYGVYHAEQWELSMLYGGGVVDPRLAARLAG